MENEQAFEADGELDALSRRRSQSSQASANKGRETMQAALGGFDNRKPEPHEHTPLLSHGGGGSRPDEYDGSGRPKEPSGPAEWEGALDFEGLPWYKRPSVSSLASREMPTAAY